MKKILCISLALSLLSCLLAGCAYPSGMSLRDILEQLYTYGDTPAESTEENRPPSLDDLKQQIHSRETDFADMEYTRPDMDSLSQSLLTACEAAESGDAELTMDCVYDFYDEYDWFYTNLSLADIHYCADLTDSYWETEYYFCLNNSAQADAALEELYYTLAASPICDVLESEDYFGAGYFDAYQGDNLWDAGFTALLEEEAALENRYYELSAIGLDYTMGTEEYYRACGNDMVELLVELIRVRQEIADYWGYSDYVQFATDYYYYRDYTPAQTQAYLKEIQTELVPLYTRLNRSLNFYVDYSYISEAETYDYVRQMAQNMGGTMAEAFELLDTSGLYDIAYSENKYNSFFEVYLTMYAVPFVFMNPGGTSYDQLTFAHEFGHFCNDYASQGSYSGVDVLEVFSQSMEYLSLCYAEDGQDLTRLKLWDSLCLFVEQAAFADFEMRMYSLTGDDLTAENLCALYSRVALEYGFDSVSYDDREFVTIPHFYTYPMYIISYVFSNDTALQIYQMELETEGAGLACLEANLDTEAEYFLEFVEEAGLASPFAEGRVSSIRKTLEAGLN